MPNQPVFGTLYTLDRFAYRQNSTLLYCTIKEIIILKIACFGVIYVPFSRVITRYYVYFFTRVWFDPLHYWNTTDKKEPCGCGGECVDCRLCSLTPHTPGKYTTPTGVFY